MKILLGDASEYRVYDTVLDTTEVIANKKKLYGREDVYGVSGTELTAYEDVQSALESYHTVAELFGGLPIDFRVEKVEIKDDINYGLVIAKPITEDRGYVSEDLIQKMRGTDGIIVTPEYLTMFLADGGYPENAGVFNDLDEYCTGWVSEPYCVFSDGFFSGITSKNVATRASWGIGFAPSLKFLRCAVTCVPEYLCMQLGKLEEIDLTFISRKRLIGSIEKMAFAGCTHLRHVGLQGALRIVGEYAFGGCESLTEIALPDTVRQVLTGCFYGSGLETFKAPDSLQVLGKEAFRACSQLKRADLCDSQLTVLREGCFAGCTKLSKVILPESLAEIEDNCFAYCKSLKTLWLPDSITKLHYRALSSVSRVHIHKGTSTERVVKELDERRRECKDIPINFYCH